MPSAASGVILAIQASGPEASVAVGRGDDLLHLEGVARAARHDDDLMPAVARSFEHISADPKDLETVCVSVGPGGFTGLRIAVSTAKMLAFALGCRLVAVDEGAATIEAAGPGQPAAVCLAGKRGSFWTTFGPAAGQSAGQVLSSQAIIERCRAAGISRILVAQPADRLGDLAVEARAVGLAVVECHPDASHVWRVGRRLDLQGVYCDPARLSPIYPREPEAVRLWEQRKG